VLFVVEEAPVEDGGAGRDRKKAAKPRGLSGMPAVPAAAAAAPPPPPLLLLAVELAEVLARRYR
jgi:hypothetical protein